MTRKFINQTNEIEQEDLESALEVVSNFLGERWIRKQEKAYNTKNSPYAGAKSFHPISKWIVDYKKNMKEQKPPLLGNTVKLERLAYYIKCLEKETDLDNFLGKLKNKSSFLPTLFELQVASYYVEQGYKIDFIPENQSGDESPEFIATDKEGNQIAIECKRIETKPEKLEKLENIIVGALRYAEKKHNSKGAYYSIIIKSESELNSKDLEAVIRESTDDKGKTIEDGRIDKNNLNYKKLKYKDVLYATIYNGGNDKVHSPEYFGNLQNPISQHNWVSCAHEVGSRSYQNITSLHIDTPYSRNIRNSIKDRVNKAVDQLSKYEKGGIFINVPTHLFNSYHKGLFKSIESDVKSKLTKETNRNIRFISLITSPFTYSKADLITTHEMVTFNNPNP